MSKCSTNFDVILYMFHRVADHSDVNNMSAANLAAVFGSILTRPGKEASNDALYYTRRKIVEIMILRCEGIFLNNCKKCSLLDEQCQ